MLKGKAVRAKCTPVERRALELIARREQRKIRESLREPIRAEAQRKNIWVTTIA